MASSTTTDIIKVIAPIALDALVKAAASLGTQVRGFALKAPVYDISPSEQMFQSLSSAGSTLWQNNFDYFYAGNASRCLQPDGQTSVKATNAGTDLLVHDASQGQVPNVNQYITTVLKGTPLSDQSVIMLAQNISDLFSQRWTEISLDWQPFFKTYNLNDSSGSTIGVDLLMYTACAQDANNSIAGLAF